MNEQQLKILQNRYPGQYLNIVPDEQKKKDGRGRPVGFHPPESETRQKIKQVLSSANEPLKLRDIELKVGFSVGMTLHNMMVEGIVRRQRFAHYELV